MLDDYLAAGEDHLGVAFHGKSFKHRIVAAHVMRGLADKEVRFGVPDDDIGIASGGELAFARVEAEQFRRSCRYQFDETVERDFARADTVMIEKLQAIFYPRAAIRDFSEVVLTEDFLVREAEGTVVSGDDLQVIVL